MGESSPQFSRPEYQDCVTCCIVALHNNASLDGHGTHELVQNHNATTRFVEAGIALRCILFLEKTLAIQIAPNQFSLIACGETFFVHATSSNLNWMDLKLVCSKSCSNAHVLGGNKNFYLAVFPPVFSLKFARAGFELGSACL